MGAATWVKCQLTAARAVAASPPLGGSGCRAAGYNRSVAGVDVDAAIACYVVVHGRWFCDAVTGGDVVVGGGWRGSILKRSDVGLGSGGHVAAGRTVLQHQQSS